MHNRSLLLRTNASRQQTGAVLIVGLIFLLVMTMLGLTAMQTTTLEEKMSGNMRDRSVAFQAAELALRVGEDVVFSGPPSSGNGVYDVQTNPAPDETVEANWNTAGNYMAWPAGVLQLPTTSRNYQAYPALNEQPKFWVETRPGRSPLEASTPRETVYTITARSTGASGTAPVTLQSTVRY